MWHPQPQNQRPKITVDKIAKQDTNDTELRQVIVESEKSYLSVKDSSNNIIKSDQEYSPPNTFSPV